MLDPDYLNLPNSLYARVAPEGASHPELVAFNEPLAATLSIGGGRSAAARAATFSGDPTKSGVAMAYSGHQFGQLVPQLGDGRALTIGEACDASGRRYEVQLKGAGRTPYSRGGDGRAALGPVLREYLLSEAMAARGIATTRALAMVLTGDQVFRDRPLAGAVLTRVSRAHLRVGTFYYAALTRDLDGIKALVQFAATRLALDPAADSVDLFREVVTAQASLVAEWMAAGFVHGVMNTDNTSIMGETIDYGPCAFLDEFNRGKVFSSIDRFGRYAYSAQPEIAKWNLARLAEALLIADDQEAKYVDALESFDAQYEAAYQGLMANRLGFTEASSHFQKCLDLWLNKLEEAEADYHQSFLDLGDRLSRDDLDAEDAFEAAWLNALTASGETVRQASARMRKHNPLIVPRNHQVERAIQQAESGDFGVFHELHDALAAPFDPPANPALAAPPLPSERVTATFCGT